MQYILQTQYRKKKKFRGVLSNAVYIKNIVQRLFWGGHNIVYTTDIVLE